MSHERDLIVLYTPLLSKEYDLVFCNDIPIQRNLCFCVGMPFMAEVVAE